MKRNGESLTAHGKVNDKVCLLTIDMGATSSIIRPDMIKQLRVRQTEKNFVLQTASGKKVPVRGEADIVIALGRKTIRATVFVLPIADEFILGLDFLRVHKFIIDMQRNVINSESNCVELNLPSRRNKELMKPTKLIVLEEELIPPFSEVFIMTKPE